MKNSILVLLCAMVLAAGVSFAGRTGPGPVGPDDCPDYDNDGICNGQDPDYVPGLECPDPDCPCQDSLLLSLLIHGNPDGSHTDDPLHQYGYYGGLEDCKDDDNDGICNGQDPDYIPNH